MKTRSKKRTSTKKRVKHAKPKKRVKLIRSRSKAKKLTKRVMAVKKAKTAKTVKAVVESKVRKTKEDRRRESIPTQKEAKDALDAITADPFALEYLKKNVSKNAVDVLKLITTPKTDEQVAELLNMKINFVRLMLNIMQGYGVTNYYIAKNNNGWLSFAWYINGTKLQTFFNYIRSIKDDEIVVTDNCNDYFMCGKCYKDTKLIFTFDAAYEAGFKCGTCNSKFQMIDKGEAERLIAETFNESRQPV